MKMMSAIPDGRIKSCKINAMRHGLRSDQLILPWESASDYEALEAELMRSLVPVGDGERMCVVGLAGCLWRLRRIPPAESQMIVEDQRRVASWVALRAAERAARPAMPGAPTGRSGDAIEPEATRPTSAAYIGGKSARRVLDYESGLLRNAKRWGLLLREQQALRGGPGAVIDVVQDEPGDSEEEIQNLG